MTSVGTDGTVKQFSKPWFATALVFLSCIAVFAYDVRLRWELFCQPRISFGTSPLLQPKKPSDGPSQSSLLAPPANAGLYWSQVPLIGLTTIINVLATGSACMGLLHLPVSVWQMLGGAMLIFAVFFSSACVGRCMQFTHWIGIAVCTLGVVLISRATILQAATHDAKIQAACGIALILLGQACQALRMVLERWILRRECLPDHHRIGWEGAWGLLLMLGLVGPLLYAAPGSDNGHKEDLVDTGVMLANSHRLQAIVSTCLFSCVLYNIAGIGVTGSLSSLQRLVLEASRSLLVWIVTMIVHYRIDPQSSFGEAWTQHSPLQLLGFVLLLVGQVIYADLFRTPRAQDPCESSHEEVEAGDESSNESEAYLTPLTSPAHGARVQDSFDLFNLEA